MSNTIKLPQLTWYGSPELEINLPDNWQVEVCNMAGYNAPAMTPEQIKAAIGRPVDTLPIRELAKGKKNVVIITDDMTRVTRSYRIVPHILEELAAAGITDNQIRFISALGCHGAMTRSDFVRKLGEETVERFPAYNHKAFEDGCTYVGTISQGVRICVNAEVMRCDLKIAIGSIEPHILFGFGGGSKIVLPGICSMETNRAFHQIGNKIQQANLEKYGGLGRYQDNPMRRIVDEAAALAGLDFKIDTLFNMYGDITHIFAGTPQATFVHGVKVAEKHYLSPRAADKDIVIANTYAKVSEPNTAITTAMPSVSRNGGDFVMICNSPEGAVNHFLFNPFGRGTAESPMRRNRLPGNVNRLLVLNEYPEAAFAVSFEPEGKVIIVKKWDRILSLLKEKWSGREAKVAVFPAAEVQYCPLRNV